MSTASFPSKASRKRRRLSLRRPAAWLAKRAIDPETGLWLVIAFAILHVFFWTLILTKLKAAQDVHTDVAEAFAWGQQFLLGYGKHPPLSGWVAGLWFRFFPAADWATYLLAMTTVGVGMVICYLISVRVVDRRRAFAAVVMLAIYPIFNFKGFKYNADLLQLVTLPLVVLAYLNAFAKPNWRSGVWLGVAAALALLTKYWVLTMFGAIGLAALIHPERMKFLRSPAPWVAIVTLIVLMIPHLIWLKEVDFAPLIYAGDVYSRPSFAQSAPLVIGYIEHNFALLLLPVLLGLLALAWPVRWLAQASRRGINRSVNRAQALNIWMIQIIVAFGPPLGGLVFMIYMKTDWGISLFFLVPLALVALPRLRLPAIALVRITAIWLVLSLVTLAAAPSIAVMDFKRHPTVANSYASRSELARQLTTTWHNRFFSRWAAVVGTTEASTPLTFYSPDHPAPYTPGEMWSSGLISLQQVKRLGFIGVCDTTDVRLSTCEAWMKANAPKAEPLIMSTQRFFRGHPGPRVAWKIYIEPPGGS